MGTVVAKIRIMPKSMEDFEELKSSLSFASVIEETPIAFGLKALNILVKCQDGEGGLKVFEEQLDNNKLISSYEVQEVGRL